MRVDRVFVSHAHIDHFIGFDRLLRLLVGREKTVTLYGPAGFIEHVGHKLRAYQWNLAAGTMTDLIFVVVEVVAAHACRTARFRLKNGFAREDLDEGRLDGGVLHAEPMLRVTTAILEHRTPCLGFAIEETLHVNVWRNRLAELGLPVGPWLQSLKRAAIEQRSDDYPVVVEGPPADPPRQLPFGELRSVLSIARGQKIGYVTDVADTPANRAAILRLVKDADILFIEAVFAAADAALAAVRAHLTTAAAGEIARQAGVGQVEPFHFSPRYAGEEDRMRTEVTDAFAGQREPGVGGRE